MYAVLPEKQISYGLGCNAISNVYFVQIQVLFQFIVLFFCFQLLEECFKQSVDTEHTASEVSEEAFRQTCDILKEKMKQRSESRLHPFAISQPVPLTEKLLSDFG